MMRTRVDPYARAAIVLLLLLVIGCSDEEPAPTACGPAGTIQGRLFGAAGPIQAAHLTFYSVSRMWNEPQTTVVAETDAEGRFAASVPAGSYTLLAEVGDGEYSYSGGRLSQAHWPLDTIAVRTGEVAAPLVFGFGSLQARVQVHPSLEGRRLCATLENWTGRGTYCEVLHAAAEVRNGSVTFAFPVVPEGTYASSLDPRCTTCTAISKQSDGGRARASGHDPGRAFTRADSLDAVPQQEDAIWLASPATHDPAGADSITITAGGSSIWSGTLSDAPALLRGTIRGTWRALGLGDPWIALYSADSARVAAGGTDLDGRFGFELLRAEPVKVAVRIGDITRWIGGTCFEDAPFVEPVPGGEVTGIDLEDAALIVDLSAPRFISHFEITADLFDAAGRRWESGHVTSSRIVLPGLDPGTYTIRLRNSNFPNAAWLGQWVGGTDSLTASPIRIDAPGRIVHVSAVLVEGGSVRGTILPPDWAAQDRRLVITTAESPGTIGQTYAEHDGSFGLLGFPDGVYKIGAGPVVRSGWTDPDSVVWYPGTRSWSEAGTIAIVNHAQVEGVVITVR